MTTTNNNNPFQISTLLNRMLVGAMIGIVIISIFLSGNFKTQPEWGKYWMIRPFVSMAIGSALGAACFYFWCQFFGKLDGWKKITIVTLGVIGFLISLYLSFVLGLAGTMWH